MNIRLPISVLYALALAALLFAASHASAASTQLSSGVAKTGIWDWQGKVQYFHITVPSGASKLVIKSWGGGGNSNLYALRNAYPVPGSGNASHYSNGAGNEASITINSPAAGTWRIALFGLSWPSYYGVSLRATFTMPAPPPPPPLEVWSFAVPFTSTGNMQCYWVDVPAGKSLLKFETSSPAGYNGDAALLYRFGQPPTYSTYDVQQQAPLSNNEWINITQPSAGRHHVCVIAASSFSNVTLRITLQ